MVALSALTDDQLQKLPASATLPPQVINQEVLRRSQMRRSAGDTQLPAMADTQSGATLNPMLQNTMLAQLPPPVPGNSQGAPSALDKAMAAPWMGGGLPAFRAPSDPHAAALDIPSPSQLMGYPNARDQALSVLDYWAPKDKPQDYIAGTGAVPPELQNYLENQQRAQMSVLGKLGGGGPKPPLMVDAVTPDYDKYVKQLAKELPSNTGELRDAVSDRKAAADRQANNAFGQAMMSTGLALLASHKPLLQALGESGPAGLQQYNQQKASAEQMQQAALANQQWLEAMDQARNAQISQGAAVRGGEDVRAQQYQNQNNLQAWVAQNGAEMQRAQMAMMKASAGGNPTAAYAIKEYGDQLQLARSLAQTDPKKAFAVEQAARVNLHQALGGQQSSGLSLLPDDTQPAAVVRTR